MVLLEATMIGKNYIDGQFYNPNKAKTFAKINPSTEETIGYFPETDRITTLHASEVARKSQRKWRETSRVKRAECFDNLAQIMKSKSGEIVRTISLETGKSFNESNAEFNESLHMVQYTFAQGREPYGEFVASEIADKDIITFRKPKGVVAVIAPWNFPFAIGGFWTSAPALLEGNTVVFKPSEDTPLTGQLIAELYNEAGFPQGVFNVIHGSGQTGAWLVESNVDHICFTGSAAVGKLIRQHCANTWNKSCSCEMGSKSAVIVFDDAPMDLAIQSCIASAFKLSGQRCVSAGRLLVQRNIFDKFCNLFIEACKNLKVGDPSERTDFGPLINKSQMTRVQDYNKRTMDLTDVLLEGHRIERKGYYLTPHVYACEWDKLYQGEISEESPYSFLQQEVFGPHVALIPFNDADDAVRIYNDTDYGLSMACITQNMSVARYMRDNCDFGLGYHNLPCIGAESHLNFGGVKASGSGGSSAAGTFKSVTHEVTWTANFDSAGFQMAQGLK